MVNALENPKRKLLESKVRALLEAEMKTRLPETELQLPGGTNHRFDMVSSNHRIIGEIKTSEPNRVSKTRGLRTAQLGDLARDCLLLLAPKGARKRILVLTNKDVHERFLRTSYAQVAISKGIEIRLEELRG